MFEVTMPNETWEGILSTIREKLGIDNTEWIEAEDVKNKIIEIADGKNTLENYLSEGIADVIYYEDFINKYVFHSDKTIQTFEAPNLLLIPERLFYDSTLRSIKCENVININGSYCFGICVNLKDIYFPNAQTLNANNGFGDITSLEEVEFPSIITIGGSNTFVNCRALKTLNFPSLVTISGSSTFVNCTALEEVEFPSLVTISGGNTFSGCTNLKSIILPSCENIASSSIFNNNTSLKEIIIGRPNCKLGNVTYFPSNFLEQATIYVPDDSVETYKSATNWSTFADIIKPISQRTIIN